MTSLAARERTQCPRGSRAQEVGTCRGRKGYGLFIGSCPRRGGQWQACVLAGRDEPKRGCLGAGLAWGQSTSLQARPKAGTSTLRPFGS